MKLFRDDDMAGPKWITLEDAAKEAGYALVPLDRLLIANGGRHFATDAYGRVHLPLEHIRRSVANEIAALIAPHLKIDEKWDGYRLRIYTASIPVILPAPVTADGTLAPAVTPADNQDRNDKADRDEAAAD
jgi:hypothetical protein